MVLMTKQKHEIKLVKSLRVRLPISSEIGLFWILKQYEDFGRLLGHGKEKSILDGWKIRRLLQTFKPAPLISKGGIVISCCEGTYSTVLWLSFCFSDDLVEAEVVGSEDCEFDASFMLIELVLQNGITETLQSWFFWLIVAIIQTS